MLETSIRDWQNAFPREALGCFEPHWYVVHIRSRHEKRVAERLGQEAIETFLPLYRVSRRWSDRRVTVELPLFPGYLFVHLALQRKRQVLCVPGVVGLVCFQGIPAAVPDSELECLRSVSLLDGTWPHPYLRAGRRFRIVHGPLCGASGILVRRKKRAQLVLSVDLIQRSVAVEIDAADVLPA